MILKEFECPHCGYFEDLVDMKSGHIECDCGRRALRVYLHAPKVHGCDSFNPHYDEQLNVFFESKDHKQKVLKDKGMRQTSGKDSPRKSTGSSHVGSESQIRKSFKSIDNI